MHRIGQHGAAGERYFEMAREYWQGPEEEVVWGMSIRDCAKILETTNQLDLDVDVLHPFLGLSRSDSEKLIRDLAQSIWQAQGCGPAKLKVTVKMEGGLHLGVYLHEEKEVALNLVGLRFYGQSKAPFIYRIGHALTHEMTHFRQQLEQPGLLEGSVGVDGEAEPPWPPKLDFKKDEAGALKEFAAWEEKQHLWLETYNRKPEEIEAHAHADALVRSLGLDPTNKIANISIYYSGDKEELDELYRRALPAQLLARVSSLAAVCEDELATNSGRPAIKEKGKGLKR